MNTEQVFYIKMYFLEVRSINHHEETNCNIVVYFFEVKHLYM